MRHSFRSGMSRNADLRAAINSGVPVGVVAGELKFLQKSITLPTYLNRGNAVFVDSGAFTAFKTGEAPNFSMVLNTYHLIADTTLLLGTTPDKLYVVSPDAVGDQVETMRLILHYKTELLALIDMGCKVIVPVQRGSIPGHSMLQQIKTILGTDRFVVGIPSCAAAMSVHECGTLNHHAFHILGRVQKNAEQISRIAALRLNNHEPDITADANWLRSRIELVCRLTDAKRIEVQGGGLRAASPRTAAIEELIRRDTAWAASD